MERTDRIGWLVLTGCVSLGLLDRAHILTITAGYASDDLAVIWLAARDMSHGVFHEPFFYGQDYGVMLEALIAAPFVALGADPVRAIPIVIAFLAMAPFWSFAMFHARRREWPAAVVFAAMPLLLPPEHGIQYTNLNGIALMAFYPWVAGMPSSGARSAALGALFIVAMAVNLNAIVACVAFGAAFALGPERRARWTWSAIGAAPALLAWWSAAHFYALHPERVKNTIHDWRSSFYPELIPEAFTRLDQHFAWLCPLWWHNGHVVLWFLAAVAIVLFRHARRAEAMALVCTLLLTVVLFGFPKTHDGTWSVFFPLSRVFLAVPLVLAWGISLCPIPLRSRTPLVIATGIITLVCFTFRYMRAGTVFAEALADQEGVPIRVRTVDWLLDQCRTIHAYADRTQAEVVVLLRAPDPQYAQFTTMGCPACDTALVPTYMPDGDRRDWRRTDEATRSRGRILVVNGDPALWSGPTNSTFSVSCVRERDPIIHLVLTPGIPVDSALALLHPSQHR